MITMASSYNRVVTRYKNGITEVIDYENSMEFGYTRQPNEKPKTNCRVQLGRIKDKRRNFNPHNVYKNCLRAKKKIRQLCNNNTELLTKFITLTYADDMSENYIKVSNQLYSKFIKRLEYYCNQKIEYLTVPELTQNGNIHYHMLSNMPYVDIEELQSIWSHGIVYINKIEDIKSVSAYISSYIDKDFGKCFQGCRHFFKSKGVVYPEPMKINNQCDYNMYNNDNLVYVSHNQNIYCGHVTTKIYDINEKWS